MAAELVEMTRRRWIKEVAWCLALRLRVRPHSSICLSAVRLNNYDTLAHPVRNIYNYTCTYTCLCIFICGPCVSPLSSLKSSRMSHDKWCSMMIYHVSFTFTRFKRVPRETFGDVYVFFFLLKYQLIRLFIFDELYSNFFICLS